MLTSSQRAHASTSHEKGARPMKSRPLVAVAVCLVALAAAAPATLSLQDIQRAYDKRVSQIDAERKKKLDEANDERVRGLKTLLDRAMDRKDLDTAIELRDEINHAKGDKPGAARGSDWVSLASKDAV